MRHENMSLATVLKILKLLWARVFRIGVQEEP
jgi:hypothetical protein